jgi:uncharacterized protein (TIGR02300 family)
MSSRFAPVPKLELGTKRACTSCGAKFYDLNKTPIACPKCGTPVEVVQLATQPSSDRRAVARKAKVEPKKVQKPELVPLEEADTEAIAATEDVEAEETNKDDAEAPLMEVGEEDDADLSEIVGGNVEDEDET